MVRNRRAHPTLDVDLRHGETVVRKSLHQGAIKFEQVSAAIAVHGQSCQKEREYTQTMRKRRNRGQYVAKLGLS